MLLCIKFSLLHSVNCYAIVYNNMADNEIVMTLEATASDG